MMKRRTRGTASIRKSKDGLYEGRYTVEVRESGRIRRKSVFGRAREEVEDKLREAMIMAYN